MTAQEVIDFVMRAGAATIGEARTRGSGGLYINAHMLSTTYEGEDGFWGVGGIRRAVSAVAITISGRVVEGNDKPYLAVSRKAEGISAALATAQRSGGVIHHWVDSIEYNTSDEPADDLVLIAAVNVMVRHSV